MSESNPLLEISKELHGAAPFQKIKAQHFIPAATETIKNARKTFQKITEDTTKPTFENTILQLETMSEEYGYVMGLYGCLFSAEAEPELQSLAQELSKMGSEFSSDISLNTKIFERVKTVYESEMKSTKRSREDLRLIEKTYTSFVRNGALLNEEDKKKLREIDLKLAGLSPKFSENVLNATNAYELQITDEDSVKNMPESALNPARELAKSKSKQGWLFNLHGPSFTAFLKYSPNRELRKEMMVAFLSRCVNDKFDNSEIVRDIVLLKKERAKLLGFNSHAHYVLEERMAQSPEKVYSFLEELYEHSVEAAHKELKELQEFAKKLDGIEELQIWDISYYVEKLKMEKFDLDDEMLRPYFSLDKVLDGAFGLANKLYDIEFKKIDNVPTYNKDVLTFEVNEKNGEFIGLFYVDPFPRDTKRPGAWATTFLEQGLFRGEVKRPHVSIVLNSTQPSEGKPSLLTFREAETLFHEFGHALHMLLTKCTYPSLSGANVYWDFVELPSQFMENWLLEKEVLDTFAEHYETGEKIPSDLVEKLIDESQFMAGWACMRQLSFGFLDMSWHGEEIENPDDIEAHEEKILDRLSLVPHIKGTAKSNSFGHIFGGGYSAGYYSYKWAEVLDADAFEHFKNNGLFSKEIATKFKTEILEKGGTIPPMELYVSFRGKEPDPKALLRRDGLVPKKIY